ncbi:MAG: EboA domain-containing protein [Myxococcota bacterium]|nr:EboA domain-containing protein [Myxococcota bacterium]
MPQRLLHSWLSRQLPEAALGWLEQQRARLEGERFLARDLYVAIGLVPRKLGKAPLLLEEADLVAAGEARPRWQPQTLTVDEAARLLLLLSAHHHGAPFYDAFKEMWTTADVGEQVAFYKGLPIYPAPEQMLWYATNGCRTSIDSVFEAIAHRNPYPTEYFDEVAWNQLCLKAIFCGLSLHQIDRLDSRHNPSLARMMTDYAYERWAAHRPVAYELWRCVGTYPDERCVQGLKRALKEGDTLTRGAVALSVSTSTVTEAKALLKEVPDLAARIESRTLTWKTLAMSEGG